eukprot:Protomagalhaensia_wolfi_Nauph_80__3699@NODE_3738_length_723_cov_605_764620_g2948_i0_p1_GENE_NODE_3738_length_723_cov_605_764620_g2948_i0NODE_3738_length_723_cov_605_764620_g2948_i0_p1_ORF_typecomplete_len172_score17_69Csa1/PF06023_12/0_0098_NODE_3738_length_723_cov_605_764620_g2948_i0117632
MATPTYLRLPSSAYLCPRHSPSFLQETCPECLKEEAQRSRRHHHHHRRSRSVMTPPSDFLPAQTRQGTVVYVPAAYAQQLAACQCHGQPPVIPHGSPYPPVQYQAPCPYCAPPIPKRGCGADLMDLIAPRVVSLSEALASPFLAMRDAAIRALENNRQPMAPPPCPYHHAY